MRMRRHAEAEGDIINMTPLIDMMFILIIFFTVSSTFREEERDIQVNLPRESKSQTLSAADRVMVVNVRRDGTYIVLNRQVTVEELFRIVAEAVKTDGAQKVLIRGDQEALHGYVARAVATCRNAGVNEANIGYQIPQ
jgi:biopolymer transport protein ExbD